MISSSSAGEEVITAPAAFFPTERRAGGVAVAIPTASTATAAAHCGACAPPPALRLTLPLGPLAAAAWTTDVGFPVSCDEPGPRPFAWGAFRGLAAAAAAVFACAAAPLPLLEAPDAGKAEPALAPLLLLLLLHTTAARVAAPPDPDAAPWLAALPPPCSDPQTRTTCIWSCEYGAGALSSPPSFFGLLRVLPAPTPFAGSLGWGGGRSDTTPRGGGGAAPFGELAGPAGAAFADPPPPSVGDRVFTVDSSAPLFDPGSVSWLEVRPPVATSPLGASSCLLSAPFVAVRSRFPETISAIALAFPGSSRAALPPAPSGFAAAATPATAAAAARLALAAARPVMKGCPRAWSAVRRALGLSVRSLLTRSLAEALMCSHSAPLML